MRTAARGGDAVQETQPHFPLKNMPPSTKRQQLRRREQPRASSFSSALPGSPHSCPAETHPREKPRENTGMASCFASHLAVLETNVKQPVILACGCTAHTACSVIHFLLAKPMGYRHGASSCGFSEVSPCTTGHTNAREESAACLDHSVIQILMQMARTGPQLEHIVSACVYYPLTAIL